MTPKAALAALEGIENRAKAAEMAAYHKVSRRYLGVANPVIDALVRDWRAAAGEDAPVALAKGLWDSDIHEARIAAAKLLDRKRIRPDDKAVWQALVSWVPSFDAWAVADHAAIAGQKRLVADPARMALIEGWVDSDHLWTRRAAFVFTLPWARLRNPTQDDLAMREQVLGWAARLANHPEWFIQKAIAWWLRDLSRRAPERTRAFLDVHGAQMKPFARREAGRLLSS